MTSLKRFKENTLMKAVVIPLIITIITVILFFAFLPTLIDSVPNAETYSAEVTTTDAEDSVSEGGEIFG